MPVFPLNYSKFQRLPADRKKAFLKAQYRFAANASATLSQLLKSPSIVNFYDLEETTLHNYLNSLQKPVLFCQLGPSYSFIDIDACIAYSAINRMLGGQLKATSAGEGFTNLENALNRKLINAILPDLSLSFKQNGKQIYIQKMINDKLQPAQMERSQELWVVARHVIDIWSAKGQLALAYPITELSALIEDDQEDQMEAEPEIMESLHLEDLEITLSARLGTAELSRHQVSKLRHGDIIALEQSVNQAIDLLVEKQPCLKGVPGLMGKRKGIILSTY